MTLTSADDLIALLQPGRWHGPAGVRPPSLKQCLSLALLLHVLAVLVLGSAPGGSARRGEGVYGALNVTLRGDDRGRGDAATVASDAYTGPQGTATQRRWGGAVRPDNPAPMPTDAPGAARLGAWQSTPVPEDAAGDAPGQPNEAAPTPAPAIEPHVDRMPLPPAILAGTSVRAPASHLSAAAAALPQPPALSVPQATATAAPAAPAAPAAVPERLPERVPLPATAAPRSAVAQRDAPVLSAATGVAFPAPPTVPAAAPVPAEPPPPSRAPLPRPSLPRSSLAAAAVPPALAAASAPALPAPPTVAEAPALPQRMPLPPAAMPPPSAVQPPPSPMLVAPADAALPAPPTPLAAQPAVTATPAARQAATSSASTTASPSTAANPAAAAQSTVTPGPVAQRSGALTDPGAQRASAGAPDAGARLGHDLATPPALPSSAPRLNLDLVRPRGGELSRHGSPGVLPVLPRPPEKPPKSKLAEELDKAAKPDCRTAYANMGLAAAAPLVRDAIQGDGCRW